MTNIFKNVEQSRIKYFVFAWGNFLYIYFLILAFTSEYLSFFKGLIAILTFSIIINIFTGNKVIKSNYKYLLFLVYIMLFISSSLFVFYPRFIDYKNYVKTIDDNFLLIQKNKIGSIHIASYNIGRSKHIKCTIYSKPIINEILKSLKNSKISYNNGRMEDWYIITLISNKHIYTFLFSKKGYAENINKLEVNNLILIKNPKIDAFDFKNIPYDLNLVYYNCPELIIILEKYIDKEIKLHNYNDDLLIK